MKKGTTTADRRYRVRYLTALTVVAGVTVVLYRYLIAAPSPPAGASYDEATRALWWRAFPLVAWCAVVGLALAAHAGRRGVAALRSGRYPPPGHSALFESTIRTGIDAKRVGATHIIIAVLLVLGSLLWPWLFLTVEY